MNYYTRYDRNCPVSQAKARADVEKLLTPWRPTTPDLETLAKPALAYYRWGFKLMLRGLDRWSPDDAEQRRNIVRRYSSLADTPSVQSNTASGGV